MPPSDSILCPVLGLAVRLDVRWCLSVLIDSQGYSLKLCTCIDALARGPNPVSGSRDYGPPRITMQRWRQFITGLMIKRLSLAGNMVAARNAAA